MSQIHSSNNDSLSPVCERGKRFPGRISPNFFIVGAAKAGTTSLYEYLRKHPQIYMSPVKETHFCSNLHPLKENRHIVRVISDAEHYLSLFDAAKGYQAIGEASTSYLSESGTAQRIFKESPEAKIIIILRDPIERAYSHYLMDVRSGIQNLSFWEAIQEDYYSEKKGWGVSHMYVELGLYYQQVKQYIDVFGRERVFILLFENFTNNTQEVLRRILLFLEIDPILLQDLEIESIHNAFSMPRGKIARWLLKLLSRPRPKIISMMIPDVIKRSLRNALLHQGVAKPPLDERAWVFLKQIYEPDLRKLEDLLGIDISSLS